jgi:hypothetical protein
MGRIEIRVMFLLACGVLLTCFALAVAQFTKSSSEFDPPTISSWDDLVKEYLIFRALSYPLVAPDGYLPSGQTEEILKEYGFEELQKEPNWYWRFDGGVFYFDDNSPLAKLVNDGERVLIYEDLAQGELLVLSVPENEGAQPREEIVYDSPAWPEVREGENFDADLWRELSQRRIAWQVTLKSKSLAEKEFAVAAAPATLLKSSGDGGGMRMMGMEETSNHLWLSIQGPAQGMTNIEVTTHIPDGFTNRLEMFTCTNLIEFWWTLAATNLSTEGMNIVCWTDNPPDEVECRYYAVGNADVDSDVDGLTDAREKFLYHTDPNLEDTDGDGLPDGVDAFPLVYDTSLPAFTITYPTNGMVIP